MIITFSSEINPEDLKKAIAKVPRYYDDFASAMFHAARDGLISWEGARYAVIDIMNRKTDAEILEVRKLMEIRK